MRESSPEAFEYELEVTEGAHLAEAADGLVEVIDPTGQVMALLDVPWALDADGVAVPTHFEVAGQTVTQIVEHDDSYSYPITADPWLWIKLISSVKATGSGKNTVYHVYPTLDGRVGAPAVDRLAALNEAKTFYPWAFAQPNIRDQFYCHYDTRLVTAFKGSWNLELRRPNVGLARTIAAKCNP